MNLIEQLGGYERAKAFLNATSFTIDELIMMQRSGLRTQHVEKALLDYRRQHNIYEVGDKVVLKRPDQFSEIYTYDAYSEKMDLHFFESESDYGHVALDRVRHATDEEIKAGKRLEVNQ
ncbi:hypothetical protein [Acinetobacter lwoffii]|uniref:hypothetical protein n=1 Tax=Acinetobacter lwoffii TaxID=28090 RepID=UPI002DB6B763|nr:hypothetical protein [Acinetobacter lwoffii]MEB6680419.1 hypothetical protein [Acinetobacter lwoffii]